MRRSTIIVFCALLLGAGVAAGCGGGDDGEPSAEPAATAAEGSATAGATLDATVGPGFTIELAAGGEAVTELAAGTYTIVVNDEATSHNFHLRGPGVDETTAVDETGETTWTVELQPGEYTFVCDPHSNGMHGGFTVG